MIYIEAACLTGMLTVGVLSSYADFRNSIVPNKFLIAGLAGGLLCHLLFLLLGAAVYYPHWLLCMLIADLLAFGMYLGKLWAAGDAKLFMILFFLTPPRLFDHNQISNSIMPFIFIFIPALLWMTGDSACKLMKKEPYKKQPFDIKKWLIGFLKTFIEVTALHSVLHAILPYISQNNELISFATIMVYAYICGNVGFMKRWPIVIIHGLIAAGLWVFKGWRITIPDYRGYLILVVVIFLQRFIGRYNYQRIPTSKTVRGMIPSAETVILFQTSRVQNLPADPSEQLTSRMTEEQAAAVRRWETSAKGNSEIWIVRKVPFAFMITLGFVSWMIFRLVR